MKNEIIRKKINICWYKFIGGATGVSSMSGHTQNEKNKI